MGSSAKILIVKFGDGVRNDSNAFPSSVNLGVLEVPEAGLFEGGFDHSASHPRSISVLCSVDNLSGTP